MAEKFWNSRKFLSLQKKWYEKIRRTGFDDAEKKKDLPRLDLRNASFRDRTAIEDYYRIACQHLNSYAFESGQEYLIWARYCDGKTFREIALELRITKDMVYRVVKKHKLLARQGTQLCADTPQRNSDKST